MQIEEELIIELLKKYRYYLDPIQEIGISFSTKDSTTNIVVQINNFDIVNISIPNKKNIDLKDLIEKKLLNN